MSELETEATDAKEATDSTEATASTWRPIVTDPAKRAHIHQILREIADAVTAWPIAERSIDTLADRAVLRTYLSQDEAVVDEAGEASTMLAQLVTEIGRGGYPACLYGGAGRASWAVGHLAGGDEADEVCRALSGAMIQRLGEDPWVSDYDLIGGLVGMGVCGLERSEHEDGRALSARVLDVLEATAQPVGDGAAWFTSPTLLPAWQREIAPEGYYNLGLAHGIPGVVALLARMVAHEVEPVRARALLARATTYLLAVEPPKERGRYAAWHPAASGPPSTRLAWCYGDLGVTAALMSAAQATGDAACRDQALALARHCALRTFEEAQVYDAGLCHGAGGAAQIFNRFWHATGEDVFADATRTWIDHVLRLRNDEPLAGFPAANRETTSMIWNTDDTLLTGATGVALVLHAAVSEVEPSWDRLLLVDLATA